MRNKVILRRDRKPTESSGGIALPDTSFDRPNWCTVIAVPDEVRVGNKWVKPSIKEGDKVFVRPMDAKPMSLNSWEQINGMKLETDYEWCLYICIELKNNNEPLEDKVLVKVHREPRISPGGIILCDYALGVPKMKEDTGIGEVVAAGTSELAPGDKIRYAKHEGAWLDDDHVIVRLDQVFASE